MGGGGGARERATTDIIAAINIGESRGSDVTGRGPDIILYLETNSPRPDLLQERGEKIHLLAAALSPPLYPCPMEKQRSCDRVPRPATGQPPENLKKEKKKKGEEGFTSTMFVEFAFPSRNF